MRPPALTLSALSSVLLAAACAARSPAPPPERRPAPAEDAPLRAPTATPSDAAPDAGRGESEEERVRRLAAELDGLEMTPITAVGAIPLDAGAGTAPPRAGSAQIGLPTGAADVTNATRVVAGMRAGFRHCFNRGLARNPSLQGGNVKLTIEIDANGSVSRASAASTGTLPDAVLRCMEARARSAVFDPPASAKAVLTVPVTFTPP